MSSSTFIQRVNVVTGSAEWCQEREDYDYHQEVARSAYADMLHDHDRNMKYYKGLELTIKELHGRREKAIVLDIGTGTGLLSMMAAKLGADRIYACEAFAPMAKCAADVIKRNGYTDRIKLIPKRSTELEVGEGKDLETRANVLVTEVFDTELIGEGAIGTYNHAHEHLLAEGAFLIPTKATFYAQVVDCTLVANWNQLKPIPLPNGNVVSFPEDVNECTGVSSVHDLQLAEIKKEEFTPLSEPLEVFKFDWAEHFSRLPVDDSSCIEFSSANSAPCSAIFTWWDLQMSSLAPEDDPANTISMKPGSAWRDHWMHAVYHIPKPINLDTAENYVLKSFHNEYSLWFDVSKSLTRSDSVDPEAPTCTCGIHLAMSRSHLGLFNDLTRRDKYLNIFSPVVTQETTCLVLSDSSPLPFLLAGLGAAKVFVLESNGFSSRAMAKLVEHSAFADQIFIINNLEDKCLAESQIDIVAGDPCFHASVLPWHNLYYWYSLQKIKHRVSPTVKLFPSKATLKLLAVEFEHLWKIRSHVGRVCNGDFDLKDFDDLIHNSAEVSDSDIDAQPLWEYPSITCSKAETLLTFDFQKEIELQSSSVTLESTLNHHPNGVALWMDWHYDTPQGETVISTGPNHDASKIVPGMSLSWDRNCKQGVYFLQRDPSAHDLSITSVQANVSFTPQDGQLELKFSQQYTEKNKS